MKWKIKDKKWTLIAIAEHGSVGSFQVRKSRLRILAIIIAGVFAIALTVLYFALSNHNMARERLEYKLERTERSLAQSRQAEKELEKQIGKLEWALASAFDDDVPGENDYAVTDAAEQTGVLAIENFEIRREPLDSTIRFKFLLRHASISGTYASGFVFAVYRPDFLDPDTWITFPSVPMDRGKPEDPTTGDPFNIARFKTVRGHFAGARPTGPYYVSIWVMSSEGELLHFKDFFVES